MRNLLACALLLVAARVSAHEGWGVVVHERHGVVFSDIPGNTIWRIADGRAVPLLRDIHSHALIAGPDGAIYGTDPDATGDVGGVWRLDAGGTLSWIVPPAPQPLLGLQAFLMTRDGTIVTPNRYDHRKPVVVLLTRDPRGAIKGVGTTRFQSVDGMAELPDGRLVVADGAFLRLVTRNGEVTTVTPALTQRRWDEDLLGLSSVQQGVVHVADHAGRRVLRVTLATGAAEVVDRSSFWWAPAGVEVVGSTLYILEHLRPPLALLGDLQLGPYLRVRRVTGDASETLGVVWGRRTRIVSAVVVVVTAIIIAALRSRHAQGHVRRRQ